MALTLVVVLFALIVAVLLAIFVLTIWEAGACFLDVEGPVTWELYKTKLYQQMQEDALLRELLKQA